MDSQGLNTTTGHMFLGFHNQFGSGSTGCGLAPLGCVAQVYMFCLSFSCLLKHPILVKQGLQTTVREMDYSVGSSFMRAATVTCVAQGVQQRGILGTDKLLTKVTSS